MDFSCRLQCLSFVSTGPTANGCFMSLSLELSETDLGQLCELTKQP